MKPLWVSHTAISACARCEPSACACEDGRCNLWSLAPPRESRRINDFASTTQPVSPCPHGPSSPGGEGWSSNSGDLLCISSTLLGWSTHFTKSPWKNWMHVMTYHSKLGMPCSPFDTFHRLESYTKSGLERLKKTDVIFAMPWHRVCSTKQKKVRSPKHKTFLIELKYHWLILPLVNCDEKQKTDSPGHWNRSLAPKLGLLFLHHDHSTLHSPNTMRLDEIRTEWGQKKTVTSRSNAKHKTSFFPSTTITCLSRLWFE